MNRRFADQFIAEFGFEGMHRAEAFIQIANSVQNVQQDLVAAFDGPLLAHLQLQFQPHLRLLEFSYYDKGVKQETNSLGSPLHEQSIQALLGIDAALQGKVERPSLTLDSEVPLMIAELRTKLRALELPAHVEDLLDRRITQLERVVANYFAYGISGLKKSYEELLGSVELYPPQEARFGSKFRDFRTSMIATLLMINGGIAATNSTINEGQKLLENVTAGAAYIEDMRASREEDAPPQGGEEALSAAVKIEEDE